MQLIQSYERKTEFLDLLTFSYEAGNGSESLGCCFIQHLNGQICNTCKKMSNLSNGSVEIIVFFGISHCGCTCCVDFVFLQTQTSRYKRRRMLRSLKKT